MPAFQNIAPVPLSDLFARIQAFLDAVMVFLWGIAPDFFLYAFVFGLIITLVGIIFSSRTLKESGTSTVMISLVAYVLVVSAPLIFGVLKGIATGGVPVSPTPPPVIQQQE
jgi:hypothetical protein